MSHMGGSEMKKRGINIRIGDGRALGEGGVAETLGNGGSQKTIVLLSLISEPEETEEDECAEDGGPSGGLERIHYRRVFRQHDPGVLEDARVSPVCVFPRNVRVNGVQGCVHDDVPNCQREGEAEINRGQSDETPVTAVSQIGVGGNEVLELFSPPHKGSDR